MPGGGEENLRTLRVIVIAVEWLNLCKLHHSSTRPFNREDAHMAHVLEDWVSSSCDVTFFPLQRLMCFFTRELH